MSCRPDTRGQCWDELEGTKGDGRVGGLLGGASNPPPPLENDVNGRLEFKKKMKGKYTEDPIGPLILRSRGDRLARGWASRYDVVMTHTHPHIAMPW